MQRMEDDLLTIAQSVAADHIRILGSPSRPLDLRIPTAFEHLFNRSWWSRIWVVQESTTQVDTTVMCGSRCVTWNELYFAEMVLKRLSDRSTRGEIPQIPFIGSDQVWKFHSLRQDRPRGFKRRATRDRATAGIEVLERLRSYNATDSRDKVFAVLRLASDINAAGDLRANYLKTPCEVYTDVVRYLISKSAYGHQLDILGHCDDNKDLPSWIPDWRTDINIFPFAKELSYSKKERISQMVY